MAVTIVRASVMHTPRDPFAPTGATRSSASTTAPLAFADGRSPRHRRLRPRWAPRIRTPTIVDARDALLLPGLVDTHVHWPQLGIVGAMGLELLDWLRVRTLPEEARLADPGYAGALARDFVRALAANGTTTALVFGSHFPAAQELFFAEAERSGLRIASGLVVSDRDLLPELRRGARRRLRRRPGAGAALARPRPPALRRHAALLALVLGADARVVRGARARSWTARS